MKQCNGQRVETPWHQLSLNENLTPDFLRWELPLGAILKGLINLHF